MSEWRRDRNRLALARLIKALPQVFPAPVLTHALERALVPPLPRLAVDSYWRAHPLRADRLARALAAKSGAPAGWTWQLAESRPERRPGRRPPGRLDPDWLAASFRLPPAPYRERRYALGPGHCCICGQKIYRFGWHLDLWERGANRNAAWHAACVVAWGLWRVPSDYARLLKKLQHRRCASTGARLWRTAEVDHRVPLFTVWREHKDTPWPVVLRLWGVPNLQVINRDAHAEKCAAEARLRRNESSDRSNLARDQ
jgi:hypothetical protein